MNEQNHSAIASNYQYQRNISDIPKIKKTNLNSFNLFIHNSFISHSLASRSVQLQISIRCGIQILITLYSSVYYNSVRKKKKKRIRYFVCKWVLRALPLQIRTEEQNEIEIFVGNINGKAIKSAFSRFAVFCSYLLQLHAAVAAHSSEYFSHIERCYESGQPSTPFCFQARTVGNDLCFYSSPLSLISFQTNTLHEL